MDGWIDRIGDREWQTYAPTSDPFSLILPYPISTWMGMIRTIRVRYGIKKSGFWGSGGLVRG